MNLGRFCQIILKSDKEISGFGQLAQHAIFTYHMVWHTPLIALPPLRFPGLTLEFKASGYGLLLGSLTQNFHVLITYILLQQHNPVNSNPRITRTPVNSNQITILLGFQVN